MNSWSCLHNLNQAQCSDALVGAKTPTPTMVISLPLKDKNSDLQEVPREYHLANQPLH